MSGRAAARLALALAPLAAACVVSHPHPSGRPASARQAPTVSAWVTTGDQSRLLARDADPIRVLPVAPSTLPTVRVDATRRFQQITGWGAAMTDASAHLIESRLSPAKRDALVRELFGRNPGAGFTLLRVPMGASDFSRAHYSYADTPAGEADPALSTFSIEPDRAEKLPALRRALAVNPQLKIVGSPWSPPGWMKTTGSLIKGTLKPGFQPAFAEYFRRWIEAYEREGVPVFAVTLQNEPHHEPEDYPGMRLDPLARASVIRNHLGPLFRRHGIRTRIWEWDHNWDEPESPLTVLADTGARQFISGVAWHCYGGDQVAQRVVRERHPDKDVWFTECSGGGWAPVWADNLKWNVSRMVIGNALNWARGVALWNLALDEHGGPHLGGCGNCRGVVTIHSVTGEVTRNPEYYALAHASSFVGIGAVRVESTAAAGLETVAFENVDRSMVLIALNVADGMRKFAVTSGELAFAYALPPGAVVTFVWK